MRKCESDWMYARINRWAGRYGYNIQASGVVREGRSYGVTLHDYIGGGQWIEWNYKGPRYWAGLRKEAVGMIAYLEAQGADLIK